MGFGGFGSLGFGRVWVIGWAVGVWGGGRLNGHEKKKMGVYKSMGVKIEGNSLCFFPHQNRSKNKGISFTFFCEIYPFCAKFFENFIFSFFL